MKTDKLKINQLSPQVYNWYLSYLKAIDTKDIKTYSSFLDDKCVMQFNNDSYAGKAAILQNLADYWTTFDSVTHDLLNIYGSDRSFALEALNHYRRNDTKTVTVRAVAITDLNEQGLVTAEGGGASYRSQQSYDHSPLSTQAPPNLCGVPLTSFRLYSDITPLFQ